tara:strand:- start:109 stop:471 length:363 start_codon:yes stop_codon:yes gene_type:complete
MKNDILDKPKVTSGNIFEVQIIESNEKDKTIMNWREGLARIWLILSVLWISGLFGYVIYKALDYGWSVDETVTRLINSAPYVVILCFGPPLLLFILYKMVCWIITGFRPKQREDHSSLDE